jgi:hypothetical protein
MNSAGAKHGTMSWSNMARVTGIGRRSTAARRVASVGDSAAAGEAVMATL